MFDYSLNKEEAKTFVRYYKEDGNALTVHYADRSKLQVENTDEIKKNLNVIQEKQINDYNKSEFSSPKEIVNFSFALFGVTTIAIFLVALFGGSIAAFVGGWSAFVKVCKISTLFYIPTICLTSNLIVKKLGARKFNLFLKYRKRINSCLEKEQQAEEVVDENTINKVTKPKKVKNLCINDINFMTYTQVKKMTKAFDKEERQIKLDKENEELKQIRYKALGIEKGKQLVKNKKTF